MNKKLSDGTTKLYNLVYSNGDIETIRALLDDGANPNIKSNGNIPIYAAVKNNMLDVVKLLAEYNADVNIVQDNMWTPFRYAVYKNMPDIVAALIPYTKNINFCPDPSSPMVTTLVADHKNTKTIKLLIKHKAKCNPYFIPRFKAFAGNGTTPLYAAVAKNNYIIASFLAKHGSYVNNTYEDDRDYRIPMVLAILNQNVNMVKMLAKQGTVLWKKRKYIEFINVINETPMGYLCKDEELPKEPPLHVAAYVGNPAILKYLLKHKAYYDMYDYYRYRPISIAAQNGNLEAVKILIKAKSNVNGYKHEHMPPLHYAAQNGNVEIAKVLVDAGANINSRNKIGWYPIHIAAYFGNLTMLKYIISKTYKVDKRTTGSKYKNYKFTPAHIAAYANKPAILSALIDAGADITLGTKYGVTPLGVAEYKHNEDAIKVLTRNGASKFNKTYFEKSKDSRIRHNKLYSWSSFVRTHAHIMTNNKRVYKL